MNELTGVQQFSIWVLPILFAITLHEVAHGWVAKILGDNTAMMLGRLTLNPLKHIDPIGTVLVPGILLFVGGFLFGWAKPVPVDWQKLGKPKRDMALVAIAGPLANLFMAVIWALVIKLALIFQSDFISTPLVYMGIAGIHINLLLMLLNLLPIPPLDGGRVMTGILPGRLAWRYSQIEPFGLLILVLLLSTGMLNQILGSPIIFMQKLISTLTGL